IFDYPNSAALTGYIREELLGATSQVTDNAAAREAEIQRVVGSIPVKRLRQAGLLDLLLSLANGTNGAGTGETSEQDIADMDLDDLVAPFLDDDSSGGSRSAYA
ncbi:MAG: polyketide synthase, partial [Mycobacterium sp.]|nr:polyketide synthase [Mycobacterium sp.]